MQRANHQATLTSPKVRVYILSMVITCNINALIDNMAKTVLLFFVWLMNINIFSAGHTVHAAYLTFDWLSNFQINHFTENRFNYTWTHRRAR